MPWPSNISEEHLEKLRLEVKTLPDKPGVYQFLDDKEEIIYVGKAKSLKKRVSSYFNKDKAMGGKLTMLVRKISGIRHIVVGSEFDAFLLENNLIKKYQPRYNIQLKDDKSFPWICVKNEPFPRIFPTRNVIDDGSRYFGPYASVRMMKTLLDLIRHLYPIRTCNLRLTKKNIEEEKFKVCLEYHIGNCLGPCEGRQSETDYNESIADIINIIKGNTGSVLKTLKDRMHRYATNMDFERAQSVKEKIQLLEKYQAKSTVVNPNISNVDVFSLLDERDRAFVNYMKVVNGAVIQSHTVEMKKKLEEPAEEIMALAIGNMRERFQSDSAEVILPFEPGIEIPGVVFTVPLRGDKKQLLDLSGRNAVYFKLEKQKQEELVDPDRHRRRMLNQMKTDLRMKKLPEVIECFDNSNFHGDYAVAAMVRFTDLKPDKKEYRHYNIRSVEGPDDFASMEEVIYRRYNRLLEEEKKLPDLIIVDGGKGQLSSALKSLEALGLRGKITIIGIAKKLEEVYYPGDPVPLYLDKRSESLKVIQRMRDEAHRFGITHYRSRHQKGTIRTSLTSIEGIGPATAGKLLDQFRSVRNIKNASIGDLAAVIGHAKAIRVKEYFDKKPG